MRNGMRILGTGAAWLSSVRAVRCWVKSINERNPCFVLCMRIHTQCVPSTMSLCIWCNAQTYSLCYYQRTASEILEEGRDDVKSAWPLWAGLVTCYNGASLNNKMQTRKCKRICKEHRVRIVVCNSTT